MMEELKPKQVEAPHLNAVRTLPHEGVPGPEGDEKTKCFLIAQMLWAKRSTVEPVVEMGRPTMVLNSLLE